MAEAFRSWEEWVGEVQKPPGSGTGSPETGADYDLGGDQAGPVFGPDPGAGGGAPTTTQASGTAGGAAPGGAAAVFGGAGGGAPPVSSSRPKGQAGEAPSFEVNPFAAPATSNPLYSGFFDPLAGQIGKGRDALGGAAQIFGQEAGPHRTFESAGGAGAIEQDIETARGGGAFDLKGSLLGADYTGPGGLSQEARDQVAEILGGLQPRGRSLLSHGGAEDLLRGRVPGLTTGQYREEAARILQDPEYRALAQAYGSGIETLASDAARLGIEAEQVAGERRGEEEAIAQAARTYLAGERGEIADPLRARVEEAKARDRAEREAWARFQETGDPAELEGLGVDPGDFISEASGKRAEAERIKAEVLARPEYERIKDIPLMDLGVSSHGREKLVWPREWFEENKGKYTKRELRELKDLARARQRDLEAAGFSPGTAVGPTGRGRLTPEEREGLSRAERRELKQEKKGAGEFALYDPLYFEDSAPDLQLPDARQYITREEGVAITPEALATEEERARYNAIQAILGEQDLLEEPTLPYREPEIAGEAERFRADELAAVDAQREALEDLSGRWKRKVGRARDQARERSTGATVTANLLRGGTGGMSLGGSEILGIGDMLPNLVGIRDVKTPKRRRAT